MMKGFQKMFIVLIIALIVGYFWTRIPLIPALTQYVLDPSLGTLLAWNLNWAVVIISGVLTLIMTLIQKFTTDQETLREIKKEQKRLNEEMKNFRDNPEKMLEFQNKNFETMGRAMEITSRPIIYTIIPLVLFFRWFSDFFSNIEPTKIFGIFATDGTFLLLPSWLWAYIIVSIFFTIIFRRAFKVV